MVGYSSTSSLCPKTLHGNQKPMPNSYLTRAAEPGAQFLTFARRHFVQIISCFAASHASPPDRISVLPPLLPDAQYSVYWTIHFKASHNYCHSTVVSQNNPPANVTEIYSSEGKGGRGRGKSL